MEQECGRGVDIRVSGGFVVTISEDVGERTRADIPLCGQRGRQDLGFVKTGVVDGEIKALARELAAVLTGGAIAIAVEVVYLTRKREVAEPAFERTAKNGRFSCAEILTIELVLEVAFVVVVVGADLEEQLVFDDGAGHHTADGVVRAAAA